MRKKKKTGQFVLEKHWRILNVLETKMQSERMVSYSELERIFVMNVSEDEPPSTQLLEDSKHFLSIFRVMIDSPRQPKQ